MRKLIVSALGAGALAIVPLSLTASPASADPGNNHNGPLSVAVCKLFQQMLPEQFDATFKNLGQCVSFLNHPPTPTPSPSPTTSPSPSPSPTPTPTPHP